MFHSTRTRLAAAVSVVALSAGVAAGPALAQPQSGLVNIDITDTTVQVPIGVAAALCGVQAGILAQGLAQGPVRCDADAQAEAVAPADNGAPGGPQRGLVNVRLTNTTVQVPVAIGATICGVQAGVLATGLLAGPVDCTADGVGTATAG